MEMLFLLCAVAVFDGLLIEIRACVDCRAHNVRNGEKERARRVCVGVYVWITECKRNQIIAAIAREAGMKGPRVCVSVVCRKRARDHAGSIVSALLCACAAIDASTKRFFY